MRYDQCLDKPRWFVEKCASTVVQAARLHVCERAGEPPAPRTCKSAQDFNGAMPRPLSSAEAKRSRTVAVPQKSLPKITVVTPNRNGGATLRQTLDSVLQQDYLNLEYILVDGGSTDDSHAILKEYRDRLTHILVGTDRTMYDGIAKGFDKAAGKVLAWLNSDDMYEPGILRRVGEVFARHPTWDVIYFDGTVWKQGWRVPNRPQRYIGLPELLAGHMLYQESVFFRRRAYEAVGGLAREGFHLAGDYDLWLRLAARFRFHFIAEHAGCFRLRSGQLSADWPAYHAEMVRARERLGKQFPHGFGLTTWFGKWVRKLINRATARRRAAVPCVRDEDSDWGCVDEVAAPALATVPLSELRRAAAPAARLDAGRGWPGGAPGLSLPCLPNGLSLSAPENTLNKWKFRYSS